MIIAAKVILNAKKDEVIEEKNMFDNSFYKVKTTKPPEDKKANNFVIELLAKHFNVYKSEAKLLKEQLLQQKFLKLKI